VFVEGEVHALVDGNPMVLHPGDVLWAGVGAITDSRIAGPGSSGGSKCKLLSHRRAIRIGSVESGSTLPRKWAVQILGKLEGAREQVGQPPTVSSSKEDYNWRRVFDDVPKGAVPGAGARSH